MGHSKPIDTHSTLIFFDFLRIRGLFVMITATVPTVRVTRIKGWQNIQNVPIILVRTSLTFKWFGSETISGFPGDMTREKEEEEFFFVRMRITILHEPRRILWFISITSLNSVRNGWKKFEKIYSSKEKKLSSEFL